METDYENAKNEILNEIKKSNKGNKGYKGIHIHGPFGIGKTVLVNSIKNEVTKEKNQKNSFSEMVVFDEFIDSENKLDVLLRMKKGCKNQKIFNKKTCFLSIYKKLNSLGIWIITTMITIALTFLPIYVNSYNAWIKYIPLFISLPFIIILILNWTVNRFWILGYINNKKSVVVLENIDRIPWEATIKIFKSMYKKAYTVIYTYSMENLEKRYQEKFGKIEKTNLYQFLDKFISKEINLAKYSLSVAPKIQSQILKEDKIEKMHIDVEGITNYRLLKRTTKKISENLKKIKDLEINVKLAFYLYYLSISDYPAFKWFKFDADDYLKKNNSNDHLKFYEGEDSRHSIDNAFKLPKKVYKIDKVPDELKSSYFMVTRIINCYIYEDQNVYFSIPKANYSIPLTWHILDDNVDQVHETYKKLLEAKGKNFFKKITLNSTLPKNIKKKVLLKKLNKKEIKELEKVAWIQIFLNVLNFEEKISFLRSINYENVNDPVLLIEFIRKAYHCVFKHLPGFGSIRENRYYFFYVRIMEKYPEMFKEIEKRTIKEQNNFWNDSKKMIKWLGELLLYTKNVIKQTEINDLQNEFNLLNSSVYEFLVLKKEKLSIREIENIKNTLQKFKCIYKNFIEIGFFNALFSDKSSNYDSNEKVYFQKPGGAKILTVKEYKKEEDWQKETESWTKWTKKYLGIFRNFKINEDS